MSNKRNRQIFPTRSAALLIAAAAMLGAAPAPVSAKIPCKNGFQVVQGNLLATPYCQDNLLGAVARQYGMRVSNAEIRNNPNTKRHVCRLVGRDIRVQSTCIESNPGRGRGY